MAEFKRGDKVHIIPGNHLKKRTGYIVGESLKYKNQFIKENGPADQMIISAEEGKPIRLTFVYENTGGNDE